MNNSPSSNSLKQNNEYYRKISYSESNMYDIFNKKTNEEIIVKNNLEEKFIEFNNPNSPTDISKSINYTDTPLSDNKNTNNNNQNKYYPIKYYIFKRLIMFMIHLGLISIFEIFFFFYIISQYEDNAFISLINTYTQNIPFMCKSFNTTEKIFFTYIFDSFVNKTTIINTANDAYNQRKIQNNNLLLLSIYYFSGVTLINIILFAIKFYYKIKINLKRILLDNLFMIIILGLYEYLFFKTVILQYRSISSDELTLNIVNNFNNCLYNNNTNIC